MRYSNKWKNWLAIIDKKTCMDCKTRHGQIYAIDEQPDRMPPIHYNCRCRIEKLKSIFAGEATDKKQDGADWYLKYKACLPDYYISREQAELAGWNPKSGNLFEVLPNKMLLGGTHKNKNKHLPVEEGREWYEVDINYEKGYRNIQRIVYSNDGLMFVTYDHYETFIEIR